MGIILHTVVTIGYNEPWEQINNLLLEAAKRTSLLSKKNKPFILHKGLNDNYVEYELNVYTNHPDKMVQIYSDMHAQIMDVFREADVEILSPRYISTRDGNGSTVPPAYTPDNRNPVEKVIDKVRTRASIDLGAYLPTSEEFLSGSFAYYQEIERNNEFL